MVSTDVQWWKLELESAHGVESFEKMVWSGSEPKVLTVFSGFQWFYGFEVVFWVASWMKMTTLWKLSPQKTFCWVFSPGT